MTVFSMEEFVANPTLSQLDECRKIDLRLIAEYYSISVSTSLVKRELKAAPLNGLVERGVFNLPAPVESPGSVAGAMAAASPGEGYSDTAEPSGNSHSDPRVGEAVKPPPIDHTPGVKHSEVEEKPFTLPQFERHSVDTSPGSRLDARLRIRLARIQLEKEEREWEFQLRR